MFNLLGTLNIWHITTMFLGLLVVFLYFRKRHYKKKHNALIEEYGDEGKEINFLKTYIKAVGVEDTFNSILPWTEMVKPEKEEDLKVLEGMFRALIKGADEMPKTLGKIEKPTTIA